MSEALDEIGAVIRGELPPECQNCERSQSLVDGLARQAVRFEVPAERMAEWCCQIVVKNVCRKSLEQIPNE